MNQGNWPLYNCLDGAVTMKVYNTIKDEAAETGYENIYRSTMDLYDPLVYMMSRGLRTDKDALQREKESAEVKIAELQKQLDEACGKYVNPHSSKQVCHYFYIEKDLKPYVNKDGNWTADDKALSRIFRKGHREAKIIQEIRYYTTLKTRYLDVEVDEDGRLRCSMNIRGTKEGRLSSSQNIFGTGTNLQNLHPRFKSFIIPDENRVFLEIDKKQAEWVVVAYLSGDPNMIKVIEEGIDPHVHTAHLLTDLPKDFIIEEARVLGHETDPDKIFQVREERWPIALKVAKFIPRTMTCRQAGKKGNHGLNYREGYKEFALQNEIPEDESERIVYGYRNSYCHVPLWWDATENQLLRDRTLVNCFGRKRRFLDEWGPKLVGAAVAFIPQSTVVDLVNRGLVKIYRDYQDPVCDLETLAQVHDSLLSQFYTGRWDECAVALLKAKEYLNPTLHYNGRDFHIDSDLKIGLNWGDFNQDDNASGMMEVRFSDNKSELADILNEAHKKLKQAA